MSFPSYPIYRVDVDADPPRLLSAVVMSKSRNGWRDVEIGGMIRCIRIGDWHRSPEDAWFDALNTCFSATWRGYHGRMRVSGVVSRAAFQYFREQEKK